MAFVEPVLIVGPEPASLLSRTFCNALICSVQGPAQLSSGASTRIKPAVETNTPAFIAASSSIGFLQALLFSEEHALGKPGSTSACKPETSIDTPKGHQPDRVTPESFAAFQS